MNDAIETVRTALCYALVCDDMKDAIVGAVNEGSDADTIGAVTGTVAGTRFGATEFPDRWLTSIEHWVELERFAQ
ncbi:ADP-ribosylglycohydrolase family protein [Natronococcus wangiae]|uniref:ADP-ribosylglycohydrolase family protein n=1 Tax=Natronococcus wangiae TaxID=3068275 RepID=UPI00273D1D8A|nr:ADP-ribosylglycohydrolase family protein [Natronococcus sp. AD5]